MGVTAENLERLLAGEKVEACGTRAMADWYEIKIDPDEFIIERQTGMMKKAWFFIQRKPK